MSEKCDSLLHDFNDTLPFYTLLRPATGDGRRYALSENKTKVSQERNGSASPISPDFQLLSSHIPSNPYPVKRNLPSYWWVRKNGYNTIR
ncbi:MAG: hypothetical protein IPM91_04920 [Bacteroidetes bacterium]|nr:hypothetical protein [Bacteroidota bacterium]